MEAKRRERILVIAALSCMGLLAADRLVFRPIGALWDRQGQRIATAKQSLEKGEALVGRKAALEERYAQMMKEGLPKKNADAEQRVLEAMGDWSSDSRMEVDGVKQRWIEDEQIGNRLEVRMSGNGNIGSISRFLYALETDPMSLRVEEVEIRARDDRGQNLTIDARFTGLVPESKKK